MSWSLLVFCSLLSANCPPESLEASSQAKGSKSPLFLTHARNKVDLVIGVGGFRILRGGGGGGKV